ncbi:MAG: hypothetical protein J6Q92_05130 [Oscillospiraceae bacterium]|nr:hypothetical protein [Oscillospiraceae bacterium]
MIRFEITQESISAEAKKEKPVDMVVQDAVLLKIDLPELSNPGTAEDLMAGKELLDGEGKIVTGSFSLEPELSTQDALIEQIKTALQNKAAVPDVKDYEGKYDVTPAFDAQVLETKDKYLRDDVQINAIPIIRVSNTSGGTTVFIANEV